MEAGGATLQDGQHELYIYKCEDKTKLEGLSYLALPSNSRETLNSGMKSYNINFNVGEHSFNGNLFII